MIGASKELTYVSEDDPPFLIVHGTKDTLISIQQAEILHKALQKSKVESTLVRIIDGGHNFSSPEVSNRIAAFFDRHLRGKTCDVSSAPILDSQIGAGKTLAKLIGSWQQGDFVVTWKWGVDSANLTGTMTRNSGEKMGIMMLGYDPTSGGLVGCVFYPWGNQSIRFSELEETRWTGVSKYSLTKGEQTSNVVLNRW